jgi:putative ABC transport system permease protein
MRLERISLVNIRKHPLKTILLVTALSVTVATVVTLLSITRLMYEDFQNKLDSFGSNMVIVPKAANLSFTYSGVSAAFTEGLVPRLDEDNLNEIKKIRNAENIKVLSPKLIEFAEVGKKNYVIVGVKFKRELSIKKWWRIAEGKAPKTASQVLLGSRAARLLRKKVGQTIKIKDRKLTIAGILDSVGSEEDNPIYIDLHLAQSIFNKPGQLNMIEAATWCYNCPIERIVAQVREKLPQARVSAVLQATKLRNQVIGKFRLFAFTLSGIVVVVGIMIVFTSIQTVIRERRKEIGIFRAIGYRRVNILEIVFFEVVLVGLLSGMLGYLLGWQIGKLILPSMSIDLPMEFDLQVAYFSLLATVVLTLATAIYPSVKGANLSPIEAINDV